MSETTCCKSCPECRCSPTTPISVPEFADTPDMLPAYEAQLPPMTEINAILREEDELEGWKDSL
jgi:hypothetical protein